MRTTLSLLRRRSPAAAAGSLIGALLVAAGTGGCGSSAEPEPAVAIWPDSLVDDLSELGRRDQEVRQGLTPERMRDTAVVGRMARTDSANSRRLRALVESHGWPEGTNVDVTGLRAAFLVLQHSPFAEWQASMLPAVEASVRGGYLAGQDYALLFDRIRTTAGEPQRYGTQVAMVGDTLVLEPLESADSVDAWRASLGLPSLDEYLSLVSEAYDAPVRGR